MEKELENKEESNKHNIFSSLNFVKNNKINFKYFECVNQISKVSNKLENFIELIDNSINVKEKSSSKKNNFFINDLNRRPMSAKNARKPDKLFPNKSVEIKKDKRKTFMNSINNNYDFTIKKRKYKLKNNKSITGNYNKNINEYSSKKINSIKYGTNTQDNSNVIGNQYQIIMEKVNTNINKNRSNRRNKTHTNNSAEKINNNSIIEIFYPKTTINKKNRPKSATTDNTVNDYYYKRHKNKYHSSGNSSKYYSRSLYKSQSSIFFDNINYKKLKPEYLKRFLQTSKGIKNSYRNDLKNVYMKKNTQKLMELAKNEIEMKDPNYHKKEMFQNLIKVKKTLDYAQKMREEQKHPVNYFGPGNIYNKAYIRKKNANLIRFCDLISHMEDEKFYFYKKLITSLYPNLVKKVIKVKYQMSEREGINEQKMKEKEDKIIKLISELKKH